MTSSLNTTSPCSTHGSNYNYQEPMRPIASTTDFEKEIIPQDEQDLSMLMQEISFERDFSTPTSANLPPQINSNIDKTNKFFNKTPLDTTVANTNQKYDYHKPDIFKVMMPTIEIEISPQDEYLSKIFLKGAQEAQSDDGYLFEINERNKKLISTCISDCLSEAPSKFKDKFSNTYLFKYLNKTKEEQENEAEVAFAALTCSWDIETAKRFCVELHKQAASLNAYNLKKLTDNKAKIKSSAEKKLDKHDIIVRKINDIIGTLNRLIGPDIASTNYSLKTIFDAILPEVNKQITDLKTSLRKLEKQALPKLDERIEDLEHVSTHVIHDMNEEVQKLSDKTTLLENKTTRLEECFKDVYFINENLKNEIADKDTKIAQLASKVDDLQTINQTNAKTIQEFKERQIKMEEAQTRQQDTLNKLLDMMQSEKK